MKIDNTDNAKEIKVMAKEVATLYDTTTKLTVTNDTELHVATDLLVQVKTYSKNLKAKKMAIINPLKKAMDEVKHLFKEPEDQLAWVENVTKDAMLAYHTKLEEAARKETERIERRVDKGTMRVDTAMGKLAGIDQAESNVQTENGSVQFKQGAAKVRITDVDALIAARPSLLHRERVLEALRLELTAELREGAFVAGLGAEIYREKVVAGVAV